MHLCQSPSVLDLFRGRCVVACALCMDDDFDLCVCKPLMCHPHSCPVRHRIRDNPTPVEFPISIIGAKPSVAVRLLDGTPTPVLPQETSRPVTTATATAAPGGKGAAVPANRLLTEGVLFERLIVGKRESKSFEISNTGAMPLPALTSVFFSLIFVLDERTGPPRCRYLSSPLHSLKHNISSSNNIFLSCCQVHMQLRPSFELCQSNL